MSCLLGSRAIASLHLAFTFANLCLLSPRSQLNLIDNSMKSLKLIPILLVLILLADGTVFIEAGPATMPIVFVSRNPLKGAAPGDLPGVGPYYRTAIVGGKLMMRERSGKLRTLVDSARLIDVADPCVSWDGKRVLFSGIQHRDSSWRIFEIGVDASGFRQLSRSNRHLPLEQFGAAKELFVKYDDFDPAYMPDGKIVFASTRYPSMAMAAAVRTSNIYLMEANGDSIRRVTSERSGGEEPTIDPVSGNIVYARWWVNVDMPSNATRNNLTRELHNALTDDIGNLWHAITIEPDGTDLKLYAGFCRTRFGMQTYKPALMRDGKLLSVFSPRTALVPSSGGTGIRWFKKGADFEHHIIGVKSNESLRAQSEIAPPFASDPHELSSNQILLSYSRNGKDYGIFSCALDGTNLRTVIDFPGTLELEPQLVAAKPLPPIVKEDIVSPVYDIPPTEDPETYGRNDFFRFDCMNIFTNAKVDEPIPDAPRIAYDLTIQFFMNPQRQSGMRPDPSILIKTAPVFYNGGVHEPDVPAEVPLFEQIIDKDNKVVETTDGKFAHVAGMNFDRLGSGTRCVGCHIGHSMIEVPRNGELSEWINVAPSASVTASSELRDENGILSQRDGFPYASRNIVDRQARVGGDSVIWIANEGTGAHVEFRWQVPIEAREFILYGIAPSPDKKIFVKDCKIFLYFGGKEIGYIPTTGAVTPNGKAISLKPTRIDAARIVISKFSGTLGRRSVAGLAEVETIARLFPRDSHHN